MSEEDNEFTHMTIDSRYGVAVYFDEWVSKRVIMRVTQYKSAVVFEVRINSFFSPKTYEMVLERSILT